MKRLILIILPLVATGCASSGYLNPEFNEFNLSSHLGRHQVSRIKKAVSNPVLIDGMADRKATYIRIKAGGYDAPNNVGGGYRMEWTFPFCTKSYALSASFNHLGITRFGEYFSLFPGSAHWIGITHDQGVIYNPNGSVLSRAVVFGANPVISFSKSSTQFEEDNGWDVILVKGLLGAGKSSSGWYCSVLFITFGPGTGGMYQNTVSTTVRKLEKR